jgi:hypothetical protein
MMIDLGFRIHKHHFVNGLRFRIQNIDVHLILVTIYDW